MESSSNKKEDIIGFFLDRKLLISEDAADKLSSNDLNLFYSKISNNASLKDITIINSEAILFLEEQRHEINWKELEKIKAIAEKNKNPELYIKFIDLIKMNAQKPKNGASGPQGISSQDIPEDKYKVNILNDYNYPEKKREVDDFVAYFNNRFRQIEKIFSGRQELQNVISINRVLSKKDKENIAIIGMVNSKKKTKNNNIMIEIEDLTGSINVVVSRNKPELFAIAQDIVLDEVIAVMGVNSERVVFANNILQPDIPLTREMKKCEDEVYALFISDLHVGSKYFLADKFNKFLKWIKGEFGNEQQRELANKVKYIFVIGDLVDGVGIYPGQEEELSTKDIRNQYEECAELLKMVPIDKKMIICPGNHDSIRLSEPQPAFSKDFSEALFNIPNALLVSNPAYINIHSSDNFKGFDVLMYHGYSFDHYAADVDSIRAVNGYDHADLIMKFLLQRRHLAPSYTSTLFIPEIHEDPLVIEKIPDFFVTGHIHKGAIACYRNITLISSSCFQTKTPFQERVGHHPDPAKVPIVNLKTREIKVLTF